MSLPRLLLVDDSEAILSFETAVLSGEYAIVTARSGRDAIAKLGDDPPHAVLLDLSMPDGDGEEVLRHVTARPELASVPVIVVSTERDRGEACLRAGAAAFVPKPIRADALLATVRRALVESSRRARAGARAILIVAAGSIELGLPLDVVLTVVPQVATRPLPTAPHYLDQFFEYHGEPVCVLDLAARLGVEPREPLVARKLVILSLGEGARVALAVDRVHDPREFTADEILPLAPDDADPSWLGGAVLYAVRGSNGPAPVVNPSGLISRGLLRRLPSLILRGVEVAP